MESPAGTAIGSATAGRKKIDTRRLYAFIKIVDIGSLTRAAAILHIAQPALSQQMAALETHFGRQLLVRSKRGVVPTQAGRALYRHAQLIMRQLDQAQVDIESSDAVVGGLVSVGLAPLSTPGVLSLPLLRAVRERYPRIVLQINENVGGVISELIMTGRMDVAFIYDPGDIRGVDRQPVLIEDLHFVALRSTTPVEDDTADVPAEEVARCELILPTPIHTIRQFVDTTFRRIGATPNVIAEAEAIPTLARAVCAGVGATVVPWSCAQAIAASGEGIVIRRISKPTVQLKVSLCTSDQLPLSEPAKIVSDILADLARIYAGDHRNRGVKAVGK